MILDNANVLTMDDAVPHASVLAVAGGKVLGGVDSREDPIASQAHEHVDLQGATVVPGFVDSHVHFRGVALAAKRLDLHAARSVDDAAALVREHCADMRATDWLQGHGLADEVLRDPSLGTALARACGEHPAALVARDGHALWIGETALERLALNPDDLDAPGGVVETHTDGTFTGVVRERSAQLVRDLLPSDDLDTRAMAGAMRAASARGVTSLHDMDGARGFDAWGRLAQERGLSLRVWQHFLAEDLDHLEALHARPNFGHSRLRFGGIKCYLDGTLGSGTAWLHESEGGDTARDGVALMDEEQLAELARHAGHAGFPLLIHAIGDAAMTTAVDALARTANYWQHLRMAPRIEHAQLARAQDIERCADLGIVLSVQPSHLVSDHAVADERWGARTADAYAYQRMLETGALTIFGSDAPIEALDPLAQIRAAVWRSGSPDAASWHAEQRVDPLEALRASTVCPAIAAGVDHMYGRLTPGMAADLVVLSGDPLTAELETLEVVATMVGGRWVFGRPALG